MWLQRDPLVQTHRQTMIYPFVDFLTDLICDFLFQFFFLLGSFPWFLWPIFVELDALALNCLNSNSTADFLGSSFSYEIINIF